MSAGYSFYLEQEDGIYRYIFVARSGLRYAVYFAAASEYFGLTYLPKYLSAYGYNFGIAKMGDDESKFPIDTRIKYTIKSIIQDFFENYIPQGILLINYDDYDSKQEKRFLCFNKWFNDLNNNNEFYKEDAEIVLPTAVIKITVILLSQHENFHAILQEFHETRNKLIEEK